MEILRAGISASPVAEPVAAEFKFESLSSGGIISGTGRGFSDGRGCYRIVFFTIFGKALDIYVGPDSFYAYSSSEDKYFRGSSEDDSFLPGFPVGKEAAATIVSGIPSFGGIYKNTVFEGLEKGHLVFSGSGYTANISTGGFLLRISSGSWSADFKKYRESDDAFRAKNISLDYPSGKIYFEFTRRDVGTIPSETEMVPSFVVNRQNTGSLSGN